MQLQSRKWKPLLCKYWDFYIREPWKWTHSPQPRDNLFEHVTKIVRPMKSTVNRASLSFIHLPFALFKKIYHQESLYTEMIHKQESKLLSKELHMPAYFAIFGLNFLTCQLEFKCDGDLSTYIINNNYNNYNNNEQVMITIHNKNSKQYQWGIQSNVFGDTYHSLRTTPLLDKINHASS